MAYTKNVELNSTVNKVTKKKKKKKKSFHKSYHALILRVLTHRQVQSYPRRPGVSPQKK
jgi:hypothetical protein